MKSAYRWVRKHPTKTTACCNGGKVFFMQRWIAIIVVTDLKVDGNHYFNLFEVKCRKEDIVEAVKAHRNVNMKGYVIGIA